MQKNWHNLSIEKIYQELDCGPDGLSSKEAEARLKKFGPNALPAAKDYSHLNIFINQFKTPLIYILLVAGLVTVILKDYIDTIVIFGTVAINTIIGFFQENKASKALQKLKELVKPKAVVLRDNNKKLIDAFQLVPGDIIYLKPGDKIPADGRIIYADNFKVNESALTGESKPASKNIKTLAKNTSLADCDNMVFMGTIAEEGLGNAIVVSTGLRSQLGKIAALVIETKEEQTPFQKRLANFTKTLGIVFGLICLLIFVFGISIGRDALTMFQTSIAIAVAAIPEGLPAVMTVILAIGMQRILKHKGLARSLLASETLGSTTIICTDKTGTLTLAKMMVTNILTGDRELLNSSRKKFSHTFKTDSKESHILALKIAALCNEAFIENPHQAMENWILRGRATDKALLLAAIQAGLNKKDLEKEAPQLKLWPLTMERKYIASLHKQDDEFFLYVSGAPEKILSASSSIYNDFSEEQLTLVKFNELKEKYENLTKSGLRVVAVAYKKLDKALLPKIISKESLENLELKDQFLKDFILTGFIALKDPLRKEVKESIKLCKEAGLQTIIVTGDHRLTAQAIAKELNLAAKKENIIEGWQLDLLNSQDFQKRLDKITIYARVEPRHKLRIVEAWQKKGEVVAMTGDGINDAPALKKADIGVALGSGTDVAKETADLVLLNDNFSIIVKAIEQGRVILDNLKKVIVYLLSDCFGEIILISGSLLLGLPLPITPAQILYHNLVNDSFPGLALAFEPKEKDIMAKKPLPKNAPLLNKDMKTIIIIVGIVNSLIVFCLFLWLLKISLNEYFVRTMIFASLSVNSLFFILSTKSLRQPIWKINLFSNKHIITAILAGLALIAMAIYVPPFPKILRTVPLTNWRDIIIILIIGFLNLFVIEFFKWLVIYRKNLKNKL